MKSLLYSLLFGAVGGLIGYFLIGTIFEMAVTKKSERETKARVQMPIFGVIGVIGGLIIGWKAGENDSSIGGHYGRNSTQTSAATVSQSRYVTACKMCKKGVGYAPDSKMPELCASCAEELIRASDELLKINKRMNQEISKLYRKDAKIRRLNGIILAAERVLLFEELGFDCVNPTAKEIIDHTKRRIETIQDSLSSKS